MAMTSVILMTLRDIHIAARTLSCKIFSVEKEKKITSQ